MDAVRDRADRSRAPHRRPTNSPRRPPVIAAIYQAFCSAPGRNRTCDARFRKASPHVRLMLASPPSAVKSGLQRAGRPTSAAESGEHRLVCYPNATQVRLASSRDQAAIAGLFKPAVSRPSDPLSSGYPCSVRAPRPARPSDANESGPCRRITGPFRDLLESGRRASPCHQVRSLGPSRRGTSIASGGLGFGRGTSTT